MLKDTNKDLQSIALDLGISKKITTYVSRHTFATILRYLGESDTVICELLNQEDEKTTKIYLDEFEECKLKESTEKALFALRN